MRTTLQLSLVAQTTVNVLWSSCIFNVLFHHKRPTVFLGWRENRDFCSEFAVLHRQLIFSSRRPVAAPLRGQSSLTAVAGTGLEGRGARAGGPARGQQGAWLLIHPSSTSLSCRLDIADKIKLLSLTTWLIWPLSSFSSSFTRLQKFACCKSNSQNCMLQTVEVPEGSAL